MNPDPVNTGGSVRSRRLIAAVSAAALAWLVAPTPVLALNAYIPSTVEGSVSVIDTATNTVVATITVGSQPAGSRSARTAAEST